jgi:hypothetical protein
MYCSTHILMRKMVYGSIKDSWANWFIDNILVFLELFSLINVIVRNNKNEN